MNFQISTYRTLSGITEVLEISRKKETQWIVYQDNTPRFFVDFFDLEIESNVMMNSLVLCAKRSIEDVLNIISKNNNVNLSIKKISRLGFYKKIKTEAKEINLDPLPEKWLSYSL
jgi:hypothetical protein